MPSDTGTRPVVRGLSFLLYAASGLVLVAAIQLFVLSDHTERFFAWTIAVPLTAAADGAFYLAAMLLLFPAARARIWAEVTPISWGVLAVSTLKLAATLLHTSLFHFTEGVGTARFAAWGWLVIYIVVPIALAALIAIELRTSGVDSPPVVPIVRPLRWVTGVVSIVLMAIGLALFAAPAWAEARWPWPLTDLTSRALAAWFVGVGIVAALAVRDGDVVRTRPVWTAAVVVALLQGVALARYAEAVDWGTVAAWGYVALFAVMGVMGAWGWLAGRGAQGKPILSRSITGTA
jgi:hypothetical protein